MLTPLKQKLPLMLIVFLAALGVGVIAVLYNYAFLWGTEIARQRFFANPLILFITAPVFFLISAYICKKFAPNAAGSGPEHVLEALKELSKEGKQVNVEKFLSFRILVVKIISSIICIAGGGALGREGPVVQISASVFVIIAQKIKKIIPNFDLRTWIVAGSAAGLAAAFNTPLAGIIFAIEELSQFHFGQKFLDFKTKAFFAVIVAGVTAQFLTGSYVLFDFPVMHFSWDISTLSTLMLLSLTCGLLAFILKKAVAKSTNLRNKANDKIWFLFPVITGLIVATISYFIGTNSFGAGMFTIQEALKSPTPSLTVMDSLGRFVNIIATSASGCAGGLLLPALAVGAGIGSVFSNILPGMDTRVFVASGMAAFLGAMINAPLTAAVLVLEVTNQRELIFPLFLATLSASWVFQTVNNK